MFVAIACAIIWPKESRYEPVRAIKLFEEAKTNLEYYASLPYRIVFYPSPEGGYAVEIPDLPGCISQGKTLEEAVEMIEDAKRCWIADALERGEPVPEPSEERYSERILLRTPKSLHRLLAEKAKAEGVSLNQYITYQPAKATGNMEQKAAEQRG